MKTIKAVEQKTDLKFLNMFQATYFLDSGKELKYNFASRRPYSKLAINGQNKIDAVRVLPYEKIDHKIFVLLIKEFRYPINDYIYSTPAGLVDDGENSQQAIVRELEEEIGASVINITKIQNNSFSSAGMSDESLECFEAEVKLDKKQKLEESEDISLVKVELDNLLDFVDSHNFGLQSALQLKMFYYKIKYMEIRNAK